MTARDGTRAPGRATRAAVLDRGLRLAAHGGLPSASIGALASTLGMSKSAVFAHFRSKPTLDREIVEAAVTRFERQVAWAAAAAPPGVARLVALSEAWLARAEAHDDALRVLTAACPAALAAPREALLVWRRGWRAELAHQASQAIAGAELAAGTAAEIVAFELDALLQAALRDVDAGDATAPDRARYAIEHLLRRRSLDDAADTRA
jgi:AcrR family transcriptional regulator